mgnify:CR=1 FL=1
MNHLKTKKDYSRIFDPFKPQIEVQYTPRICKQIKDFNQTIHKFVNVNPTEPDPGIS